MHFTGRISKTAFFISPSCALTTYVPKINKVEIVETIGGDLINIDDYVESNYIDYTGQDTHFFKETFYYPLADMFGVPRSVMDNYVKPHFVPQFINAFILSRFPQKVINRIHYKNKYISYCRRRYHHYQIMTKKADDDYRLFIGEVEQFLARTPKPAFKDFVKEFCPPHNISVQLDLFENLLA